MIRLLLLALVSAFAFPAFGATFTPLGILPGGTQSFATGVSNVGSVAVGWSHSTEGPQAFRWTPSSGITGLGDLPGGPFNSFADDVSSDGSVVVGTGRAGDSISKRFDGPPPPAWSTLVAWMVPTVLAGLPQFRQVATSLLVSPKAKAQRTWKHSDGRPRAEWLAWEICQVAQLTVKPLASQTMAL